MNVWIGTSGYSYPDWVGEFYPPGLPSGKMLGWYSRFFPLVEINFTFYRVPTAAMLLRLAAQTQPEFQFLIKLPRSLSHEENPRDLADFHSAVLALKERGQLMGLLCQLPQSTHNKPPHRTWLAHLGNALGHLHLAVEFRHRSWATPELVPWLQEHQLELVSVDAPPIATLFPSGVLAATPRLYVRLHSRRGAGWYAGEKERYDYNYTDAELAEWITALSEASESHTALLLFNNCYRSQAARNASRLQALLAAREGPFEVVSAFAERPPVQRSLF